MKEIKNFIEERQRLQDEGFQLVAFQEFTYFDELQDQYCEKVLKFEERLEDVITNTPDKMNNFLKHSYAKKKTIGDSKSWKVFHTATSHGFSGGAIAHLEEVDSAEGNLAMKQTFMAAFERIVGDTKEIPDKSCILLSASKHRMALCKERAVPNKVAKREAVAKLKGQTVLENYFRVTKSPSVASPYKKPVKIPKYRIEKLVQDLRGDSVKILWIPSGHYDLDPAQYVTVYLRNEIALSRESNNEVDFRTSFDDALSKLALEIWSVAFQFTETAIDFYLKGGNAAKEEAGPSGLTLEGFNAGVAAFEARFARHSSTDNETADKENHADEELTSEIEVEVEIEEEISD